jgi:ubiquinone/menaquinone biosynthesis C-methylase UbiE
VLCRVRDHHRALDELFRVIRPGGELRYFEHARIDTPELRACSDPGRPDRSLQADGQ